MMPDVYNGPIDLKTLVDFDARVEDFACPFTFLAFPVELVGQCGVPADRGAEAYIAAVQSEGVNVGIWTKSSLQGTAYAAVDQDQIARLHEAIDRLIERGQFDAGFAAELSDRLCQSELGE